MFLEEVGVVPEGEVLRAVPVAGGEASLAGALGAVGAAGVVVGVGRDGACGTRNEDSVVVALVAGQTSLAGGGVSERVLLPQHNFCSKARPPQKVWSLCD